MTATMVHDGQPVHDRFKIIDDNAVLGVIKGKLALDPSSGRHSIFIGSCSAMTELSESCVAQSFPR